MMKEMIEIPEIGLLALLIANWMCGLCFIFLSFWLSFLF